MRDWRFWAVAGFALALVLDPLRVVSLLLLVFCLGVLAVFLLGMDRIGGWAVALHRRMARRNPDRAERLRQRSEALVTRLETLLDHLPRYLTDGLHLPDLSARRPDEDRTLNRLSQLGAEK